ncbi:MAG: hypothetical protein AABX17_01570 [Nanoarchaeota archaeon]
MSAEKVIYFGGFIPEWAKGLPKDLDFFRGYLFNERNTILATLEMGSVTHERLYEDSRTLDCVRTILAEKQWDDPNAEKYVERYTGKWSQKESLVLPSRTISRIINAVKRRDSADNTLYQILNKIMRDRISSRDKQ